MSENAQIGRFHLGIFRFPVKGPPGDAQQYDRLVFFASGRFSASRMAKNGRSAMRPGLVFQKPYPSWGRPVASTSATRRSNM